MSYVSMPACAPFNGKGAEKKFELEYGVPGGGRRRQRGMLRVSFKPLPDLRDFEFNKDRITVNEALAAFRVIVIPWDTDSMPGPKPIRLPYPPSTENNTVSYATSGMLNITAEPRRL